jgi:hypothetical protein
MKTDLVEIYSDASNAAVMRHPGRRFPGVLVQGDTLYSMAQSARRLQQSAGALDEEASEELTGLVDCLDQLLAHYKTVLKEHQIELPFRERFPEKDPIDSER